MSESISPPQAVAAAFDTKTSEWQYWGLPKTWAEAASGSNSPSCIMPLEALRALFLKVDRLERANEMDRKLAVEQAWERKSVRKALDLPSSATANDVVEKLLELISVPAAAPEPAPKKKAR